MKRSGKAEMFLTGVALQMVMVLPWPAARRPKRESQPRRKTAAFMQPLGNSI